MRPATPRPGASALSTWHRRAATSLSGAAIAMMVAVLSLALLWVALRLAGFDATLALGALWRGSFGTWYALTSSTLVRATPLVLTGLAVAIAFRAGVWNIGADGQLLVGVAALLRTKFGVLEVISTIMLNFVAVDLVGYLVRGPLQEPSHAYPQSDPIPATMHLPIL